MKLDPDPTRLAQLSAHHRPEGSGIWWVTVIAIGVLIGNLLSFGSYKLYVSWELHRLAISLRTEAAKQAEISKVNMERITKNNEALRKEREKQSAINATLLETCAFWRQQVVNENTLQNRAYRDAACSRASSSVR